MAKSLSLSDVGKSCSSSEFVTWQICLLTLFLKIKFSQKFPNSQYECSQGPGEDAQACQNRSCSPMPKYQSLMLVHIMKETHKELGVCL